MTRRNSQAPKDLCVRVQLGDFATTLDGAGRVLFVHRTDRDWWRQLDGGIEPGETPWEGVIRERRAEALAEVTMLRLKGSTAGARAGMRPSSASSATSLAASA